MSVRVEYRAVASDNPDPTDADDNGAPILERWSWTTSRARAEEALLLARNCIVPYDDCWLEVRLVTYGEPERVEGA